MSSVSNTSNSVATSNDSSPGSRKRRSGAHHRKRAYDATPNVTNYQKLYAVFENAWGQMHGNSEERELVLRTLQLKKDDDSGKKTELHLKSKCKHQVLISINDPENESDSYYGIPGLTKNDTWMIIFVEKLLRVMEPKANGLNNMDLPSDIAVPTAVPKETADGNETSSLSELFNSDILNFNGTSSLLGDRPRGQQDQDNDFLTAIRDIESLPEDAIVKRRAIPMETLRLRDESIYSFLASRFHPCFLPTSTRERLVRLLFSENDLLPNPIGEPEILAMLKQREYDDIASFWAMIGIPFVQLHHGEGITFALQRKCNDEAHHMILEMFQHSVKRNDFNQVAMAIQNNATTKLSPDESDDRMWDVPATGQVIAVPWLRPTLRHYLDVSKRTVTFMMGSNLENASKVFLKDKALPPSALIWHTELKCLGIPQDIGRHHVVVISTNTCLIFCSRDPVDRQDVEIYQQRNSSTSAPVLHDKNVKQYGRGHFEGLLLGHFLNLARGIRINGNVENFKSIGEEFGTFPWTSLVAHVRGVDVDEVKSLSAIGRWDEIDEDEDHLWPMPKYLVRRLSPVE